MLESLVLEEELEEVDSVEVVVAVELVPLDVVVAPAVELVPVLDVVEVVLALLLVLVVATPHPARTQANASQITFELFFIGRNLQALRLHEINPKETVFIGGTERKP